MEKSIETIWKEGFLEGDALVAPKLNDMYNQKSHHIIDKFKRMYKTNLIAIVALAFIILAVSITSEMVYMGILMFLLFNVLVMISIKHKNRLEKIDTSLNSYQYLKSFDSWMKEILSVNAKMNRFVYPYIFLSMIIGFWFGGMGGNIPGEEFVNSLLVDYPNTYLFMGLPLFGIIGVVFVLFILSFFGARIGKFDFDIVYGRILKKVYELLADMEDLRS